MKIYCFLLRMQKEKPEARGSSGLEGRGSGKPSGVFATTQRKRTCGDGLWGTEQYLCRVPGSKAEAIPDGSKTEKGKESVEAAWQMAGCGTGLTPSSDDLLCGYLAGIWPVWPRSLVRRVADKAASRTNDISGALLRQAGAGRFSWDILQVIWYMEGNARMGSWRVRLKRSPVLAAALDVIS